MEDKNGIDLMKKVYIHESQLISPLGFSTKDNFKALCEGTSGIKPITFNEPIGIIFAGKINEIAFQSHIKSLDGSLKGSRIEQIIIAALHPLVQQRGIASDTLLIISTTKGNVKALENQAIDEAHLFATALQIQKYFGFKKKPIVVSNACVSGVMALSLAKRLLQMNEAKDVFVVAVDELVPFIISGFQSFQAMSDEVCKPYDEARKGVNLGEAAAAVYLNTEKEMEGIEIAGDANCNDANHISGPSRTGEGLYLSITRALKEAQVNADAIDYVSLHGTATLFNDEMESIALQRADLLHAPVNSFKGYYGHTLGASGLLETVLTMECIKQNVLIPSFGFENLGVSQPLQVITELQKKNINIALKTASGFGGSNSAIVLKK